MVCPMKTGMPLFCCFGPTHLNLADRYRIAAEVNLTKDDLAVLIGSQSVLQLYQLNNDKLEPRGTGSQSADKFFLSISMSVMTAVWMMGG